VIIDLSVIACYGHLYVLYLAINEFHYLILDERMIKQDIEWNNWHTENEIRFDRDMEARRRD